MQMPLLPSPVERPHGIWSDIGRWMVGEIERPACLPTTPGSTREVVRGCGCRQRQRMGFVGWLSVGRSRLCREHRIWQEAT